MIDHKTSLGKIALSAAMAGLLGSNAALAAAPLMQNLQQADGLGAGAKQASGEAAAYMSQDSFNALMQMPAGADQGGASSVYAGGAGSSRPAGAVSEPQRRSAGALGGKMSVPSAGLASGDDWNSPKKGWNGFTNGFDKGFGFVEAPAAKIFEQSVECGSYFCLPSLFWMPIVGAGLLVGAALAAPAAIVGLATGLFGAIFGAREY